MGHSLDRKQEERVYRINFEKKRGTGPQKEVCDTDFFPESRLKGEGGGRKAVQPED